MERFRMDGFGPGNMENSMGGLILAHNCDECEESGKCEIEPLARERRRMAEAGLLGPTSDHAHVGRINLGDILRGMSSPETHGMPRVVMMGGAGAMPFDLASMGRRPMAGPFGQAGFASLSLNVRDVPTSELHSDIQELFRQLVEMDRQLAERSPLVKAMQRELRELEFQLMFEPDMLRGQLEEYFPEYAGQKMKIARREDSDEFYLLVNGAEVDDEVPDWVGEELLETQTGLDQARERQSAFKKSIREELVWAAPHLLKLKFLSEDISESLKEKHPDLAEKMVGMKKCDGGGFVLQVRDQTNGDGATNSELLKSLERMAEMSGDPDLLSIVRMAKDFEAQQKSGMTPQDSPETELATDQQHAAEMATSAESHEDQSAPATDEQQAATASEKPVRRRPKKTKASDAVE